MEKLKRMPFKAQKAVFEKLEEIVDIAALSKDERERYDESIRIYRDHLVTVAYAEEKGRAEGRAEGLATGLATGRAAAVRENARRMKDKGYPLDDICDITGLSVEEISRL